MSLELVGQIVLLTWCAGLPAVIVVGAVMLRLAKVRRVVRMEQVTVVERERPARDSAH